MSTFEEIIDKAPDNVYFDGKVVSWNVIVNGNKATLGRINCIDPLPFPMAESGERFSLYSGAAIRTTVPLAEDETMKIELNQPGHICFFPGGIEVEFFGLAETYYLCEYPGLEPLALDLPVLSHHYKFAKFLKHGDYVGGMKPPTVITFGEGTGNRYFGYPILNTDMPDGSRILLEVPETTEDAVYLEGKQIEIEVLQGTGILNVVELEGYTGKHIDLSPGVVANIDPNSYYLLESTGDLPLVVRDTTPGFRPEHEVSLDDFLASLHKQRNGVSARIVSAIVEANSQAQVDKGSIARDQL